MDARDLNRLLELRAKDLASKAPGGTVAERRTRLGKCLGLEPVPPRTELAATVTGTIERNGYRIEKVRYESRPGVLVTAHLYLPAGSGKWPVVLRSHGHDLLKKNALTAQASGISFALAGYACLVVDSPGHGMEDSPVNERSAIGSHDDLFLGMGAPVLGCYVWDLIRGLDYLGTRGDTDLGKVGITGDGMGGLAAIYAFALDERILATAPVCTPASFESGSPSGCICKIAPGILTVGDTSDIIALRAEDGAVMLLTAENDIAAPFEPQVKAAEKIRRVFRNQKREGSFRFERFHGGRDYNRRMREAVLAFFNETLQGMPAAPYTAEARPITDGALNPYPAETVDPADQGLLVTDPEARTTRTFRDLLTEALARPYPEPYRIDQRLVSWRKYGSIESLRPGAILALHDESISNPKEPGSITLPHRQIDERLCLLLGLSVSEFLAQAIHYALPGGPETWESSGTGVAGDALTSMIASVRTLVSTPEAPPKLLVAEGPISSMVARFLARYRPAMDTQCSHLWTSWREAVEQSIRENAQPGARYLEWV